jgi:hypothetical protein
MPTSILRQMLMLLLANPAACFSVPTHFTPAKASPARGSRPITAILNMNDDFTKDALMAKYVLLRSQEQTDQETGWAARTPGTARTVLISSVLFTLASLPLLIKNPFVLTKLLELAALSVEGVTPMEFFRLTGSFW